jgi:hypothetical protein
VIFAFLCQLFSPSSGFTFRQCCGSESESGSESERIRAFLAGTESEMFFPDSDSDPNSDPDPVPNPVI